MRNTIVKRALALLVILTVIAAGVPTLAEGGFSAYVSAFSMAVYRDAKLSEYWGAVPQNTVVTVNAYKDGVAQITCGGRTGYASIYDMKKAEAEDDGTEIDVAAKTTRKTRIYQSANLKSRYISVPKGYTVNVISKNGSCARVERGGVIGYMYAGHLKEIGETAEAETVPLPESVEQEEKESGGVTTLEEAVDSGKYSNEQLLYMFAVKVIGYNSAAACALLGNCYFESGFSTSTLSDGGSSYGMFQWHNGRWTSMRNWCKKNGYDYMSIVGQLYYLKHDLEKNYPKVHSYLKSVPDTAQGAYDGAYYFCTKFLVPANKESQGAKRGNRAKDVYWKKYSEKAL